MNHCLSFLFILVLAGLVKLLFYPPTDIVLHANSEERSLREGKVFTHFLAHADWYRKMTSINTNAPFVNSVEDVPDSFEGPAFYRLTEEGLKSQCPPETLLPDGGGVEFARYLFSNTEQVAVMGDGKLGPSVVGCTNITYLPPTQLGDTLDLDRYSLYFDGHLHRSLKSGNAKALQKARTVSNFFSNFTNRRITAPLHGTVVSSKVVVCSGKKTWFFFEPDCCNSFGHHIYNGATLGKGFPPDAKITALQVQRGDILTFGSYHHHLVVTDPGPSFMQTYRILNRNVALQGVLKYGAPFVRSVGEVALSFRGGTAHQGQKQLYIKYCNNKAEQESFDLLEKRILESFP